MILLIRWSKSINKSLKECIFGVSVRESSVVSHYCVSICVKSDSFFFLGQSVNFSSNCGSDPLD